MGSTNNAWSFSIGRVAGIQLEVHVTFLVMLAWVVWLMIEQGRGASSALYAVVLFIAAFATILLHELGHALTARRFGIRTIDIQLTPMGGMSHLEQVPEKPHQELLISLAGPLVSFGIAGALYAVLRLTHGPLSFGGFLEARANPLTALMWLNLVIALYNLLPIFPMDGGRALRATFAFFTPYPKATKAATRIAQVGSVALAVMAKSGTLVYVLTAVWVWMSARRELRDVRGRFTVRPFSIRDVMVKEPLTLELDDSLKAAAAAFVSTFQSELPVMQGGSVAGVLGFPELLEGLEKKGEAAAVREVMRRDPEAIEVDSKLEDALAKLNEASDETDSVLMVLERDQLVGVVPMSNLKELIKVEKALHRAA